MAESAVVVGNGTEATPPAPGFWPTVKLNVNRPSLRLSSEFDSESSVFLHKVSCKVLDSLAKLKLSFHHELTGADGSLSRPQLSLVSKHLSVHHDFQDNNTLLSATLDLSPERLQLRASHDLKSQQGDLSLLATLPNPNYSIHLSTPLPPPSALALPKATFKFPLGELCLEEQQDLDDDANTAQALSVNGIVKANLLNGLCSAQYADDHCNLRYSFKDDQMAFIPSISLPSNALSFAFKRRFSPCHKLSYWYNFDVNNWSAVYKHTYGKDLKLKAGYDSEVRIGWASLWVTFPSYFCSNFVRTLLLVPPAHMTNIISFSTLVIAILAFFFVYQCAAAFAFFQPSFNFQEQIKQWSMAQFSLVTLVLHCCLCLPCVCILSCDSYALLPQVLICGARPAVGCAYVLLQLRKMYALQLVDARA